MIPFLLLLLPAFVASATPLECAMWGPFMGNNCTVHEDGSCDVPPAPEGTRWNQSGVVSDETEIFLLCTDEKKILIGGSSIYCDSGEWRMRKLGYCEDIAEIGKVVQILDEGYVVVRYDNLHVLKATKKLLRLTVFFAYHGVYDVKDYKGPIDNDGDYKLANGQLYKDGRLLSTCHGNSLMLLTDYAMDLTLASKIPRKTIRYRPVIQNGILFVNGVPVAKKVERNDTDRLEGTFTVGGGNIYQHGSIVAP